MPIDNGFEVIEDTDNDGVIDLGVMEDWEEVETEYEVFKDSYGKVYKVSEETKEEFLSNHPGAESIPDGGPYNYDESYLVEDKEVEETEEDDLVMDGFEVIEDGSLNAAERIEIFEEQEEYEDQQEADFEDWKVDKGYVNEEGENWFDEPGDIITDEEGNEKELVTPGIAHARYEDEEVREQRYMTEYLADQKEKEADKLVNQYGEETTDAAQNTFLGANPTVETYENFIPGVTPLTDDIWQPEFENQTGRYDPSKGVLALPGTNSEPLDELKLEGTRDKWTGYEAERIIAEDERTLTNQLIKEYKDAGYIVTSKKGMYDGPRKTISTGELKEIAREKMHEDRKYKISQYASTEMQEVKVLEDEYIVAATKYGPNSSQAQTLLKKYKAAYDDLHSYDSAKPLFDPITEQYLKDRPEVKQAINDDAKEMAETTPRDVMEEEHLLLQYRIEALQQMMARGGVSRIWDEANGWDGLQELGLLEGELINASDSGKEAKGKGLAYDAITGNKKDLSMSEDIKRILLNSKEGKAGNRLPYATSVLQDNNAFNEYYNKQFVRYLTIGKALEYNYDPTTLAKTGTLDHFLVGAVDLMADEGNSWMQHGDKLAKDYVESMKFLRGENFKLTPEEEERLHEDTFDLIAGGLPEFMALMAIMATVKAPVAGAFGRLSTLGGRLFGMGETNALARGFGLIEAEAAGLGAEAAGITVSESPILSYTMETIASGFSEVGAGIAADKVLGGMGGQEMGWQMWAGFGAANPIAKRVINKLLTPIMMGETKGLVNWKEGYRNNTAFKATIDGAVSSTVALPTTVAVELFDATFIDPDNPDKTLAHITDPQKLMVLWGQLMLTGAFSNRLDYQTGIRKFGDKLSNKIMGYPVNSPQANAAAKRLGFGTTRKTMAELSEHHLAKEQELLNDPKYKGQHEDGLALEGTELATKLEQLNTDLKTVMFHNEVLAVQKQIGKVKNPDGVYETAKRNGDELLKAVIEHQETAPEGTPMKMTPEQIEYLANTPQTLIDMSISGDVRSKAAIDNSVILAKLKKKAIAYQKALDGMGFKKILLNIMKRWNWCLNLIDYQEKLKNCRSRRLMELNLRYS